MSRARGVEAEHLDRAAVGRSRPVIRRIRVVLPAPSGPTRPVMRPATISPLTASSAGAPPVAEALGHAVAVASDSSWA